MGWEAIISSFFSSVFFSAELIWCWLRNKKDTRGVRGYVSSENFWKFLCYNGYFSPFWIIFRQILFKFFDPNCECFAKYDAFCSDIFDYACLKPKAYHCQRGSKLWKNCRLYIKNIFENGWWENAYSSTYPLGSAPGHKLQKLSKKSGTFQSLGTISFVLFF